MSLCQYFKYMSMAYYVTQFSRILREKIILRHKLLIVIDPPVFLLQPMRNRSRSTKFTTKAVQRIAQSTAGD